MPVVPSADSHMYQVKQHLRKLVCLHTCVSNVASQLLLYTIESHNIDKRRTSIASLSKRRQCARVFALMIEGGVYFAVSGSVAGAAGRAGN